MPGQPSFQGKQPPLGPHFYQEQQLLQGGQYFSGNYPSNYQTYIPNYQPSYGPSYTSQPSIGAPYPRVNTVWDPSLNQQNFQPTMQVTYNQLGQSIAYTQIQEPVQPMLQVIPQVSAPSSVQQPGPSTPRNPPQIAARTSVQPTTPIPGISATPISTTPQISQPIPQVTTHQPRPIVQTTIQMYAG